MDEKTENENLAMVALQTRYWVLTTEEQRDRMIPIPVTFQLIWVYALFNFNPFAKREKSV